MRILFVSTNADGAWLVWILQKEGHKVDWVCGTSKYEVILSGLIPPPLVKLTHNPEDYDLIVFDTTGTGKLADAARVHTPVIGDSLFCDTIEHDRITGIRLMEEAGIKVPPWEGFSKLNDARKWLASNHKRCVFKPCGDSDSSTTYVSKSADDMLRYFDTLLKKAHVREFMLQEFIEGTEISTEGWFNGRDWVLIDHTLEEKKFMSGNLGPNTGCSGNVVWIPPRHTPVFQQGLDRFADHLRSVNFVGPIDLNTIVTETDVYGIEWTPRFGYEGTCNLVRLLPCGFGYFMHTVAMGQTPTLSPPRHAFCAAIRLSVPPYPNESKGAVKPVPIYGIDIKHLENFYVCNASVNKDGELETIVNDQPIGCPLGCAETISQAFEECEIAIKRLQIPDLQWRNDVPSSVLKRYNTLLSQGWLRPVGPPNM